MKGLNFLKKVAMHYIVLLFVTALIGQPILNGIILAEKTTVVTVTTILEEENNEEIGDEDSAETSIESHLSKYDLIFFASSFIKVPKIRVIKELSFVLDTFIPPPEVA